MTPEQIERMKRYTDKHVRDPQPGDHFTEMCGSVAYIDSREGDNLMVRKTSTCGPDKGWTMPARMTVAEFIKWASYDIRQRIDEACDTLRGQRPSEDSNSAPCPEPSGLVPLLSSRLSVLDSILHDQRQGLNRLAEGLREAPPATQLGGHNSQQLQAKYATR